MVYTLNKLSQNLKKAYSECQKKYVGSSMDTRPFSKGPVCAADLEKVIGPTILANHHRCVSEFLSTHAGMVEVGGKP
jgi:hypothetical protein